MNVLVKNFFFPKIKSVVDSKVPKFGREAGEQLEKIEGVQRI